MNLGETTLLSPRSSANCPTFSTFCCVTSSVGFRVKFLFFVVVGAHCLRRVPHCTQVMPLRALTWTSMDANHHWQFVYAVKNGTLPTELRAGYFRVKVPLASCHGSFTQTSGCFFLQALFGSRPSRISTARTFIRAVSHNHS